MLRTFLSSIRLLGVSPNLANPADSKPIVSEDVVFEEQGGILTVEAELFHQQTGTEQRAFCLTTRAAQQEP